MKLMKHEKWNNFLKSIKELQDPLLLSIFLQAKLDKVSRNGVCTMEFDQEMSFFNDWIHDTKALWQPLLKKHMKATYITPIFVRNLNLKLD